MSVLNELLKQRWVLKANDPELYYKVKEESKVIKKFVNEKLGYQLIINQKLIKLEKLPGKAETWMGIQEFQTVMEYRLLCIILMYLEEMEVGNQFILSNLTEYIQIHFPEGEINWTVFSLRCQLVRVLKFMIATGMLLQHDGDEDLFKHSIEADVLYENTGISHYFMRNFSRDIMEFKSAADFEKVDWFDQDEDRGILRRQRIYRKLLLSCGVYKSSDDKDEDFLYIKNYRNLIESDFQKFFPCSLHVHSSSAYLIPDENAGIGKIFPERNTLSDCVLTVNNEIQRRISNYQLKPDEDEIIHMDKKTFLNLIQFTIKKRLVHLPKTYRDKDLMTLCVEIFNMMKLIGFIADESNDNLRIYPAVGKICGDFPESEGGL